MSDENFDVIKKDEYSIHIFLFYFNWIFSMSTDSLEMVKMNGEDKNNININKRDVL